MPGGASQDMLLDDLFEDIYQIVMYLLWSQSVCKSNDECCVVYIVITALYNALLSFQLLSFVWKTELLVSCQPNKPRFCPHSVPSGIKLYLTWQGDTDARSPGRRLMLCFPSCVCAQQSPWGAAWLLCLGRLHKPLQLPVACWDSLYFWCQGKSGFQDIQWGSTLLLWLNGPDYMQFFHLPHQLRGEHK